MLFRFVKQRSQEHFVTVFFLICIFYAFLYLQSQASTVISQPLHVFNSSSTWISAPVLLEDRIYVSSLQWDNPGYTNLICFQPSTLQDCPHYKWVGTTTSQPVSDQQFIYVAANDIHQVSAGGEEFQYKLQSAIVGYGNRSTEVTQFGQFVVARGVLYGAYAGGAMIAMEVKREPIYLQNMQVLWTTPIDVEVSSRVDLVPFITEKHIYAYSEQSEILKINKTDGNVEIVAKLEENQSFSSSPIVGGNVLYVGLSDGTLWGINLENAKIQVDHKFAGSILTRAVYNQGALFFGASDGYVYAVNVGSSNVYIIWRYKTFAAINSFPVISRGILYIGSDDNILYGLNVANGRLKWSQFLGSPIVESVVSNNTQIYCTTTSGSLYALNINDKLSNTYDQSIDGIIKLEAFKKYEQSNILTVAQDEQLDIFLYASRDGYVGCVQYSSLKNLWRKKVTLPMNEAELQIYNGKYLIVSTQAQVIVFEISGGGRQLWSVDVVAPQGPALVSSNRTIVVTTEGVFEHNLLTGKQGWRRDIFGTIVAPGLIHNNIVYVLSSDGLLQTYDETSGSSGPSFEKSGAALVKPLLQNDILYVQAGGNVYALNCSNGMLDEIWHQTIGGTTQTDAILGQDMLYVVSSEVVYAFHQLTGQIEWEKNVGSLIKSKSLIQGLINKEDSSLMVETIDQTVYILDTQDGTMSIMPENDLLRRFGFPQFSQIVTQLLINKHNKNKTEQNSNYVELILEDEMVFVELEMLKNTASPLMEIRGLEDVLTFLGIDTKLVQVQSITSFHKPPLDEDDVSEAIVIPFVEAIIVPSNITLPVSSKNKKKSGVGGVMIYIIVCGGVFVIVSVAVYATWRSRVSGSRLYRNNNSTTSSLQQQLALPSVRFGSQTIASSIMRTISQTTAGNKCVTASDMPVLSKFTQTPKNVDLDIDFYRELDIRMEIGSGGFGSVMGGIYSPKNQNVQYEVAVKQLHNSFIGKTKDQVENEFNKEIALHAMLRHPNIVKCFGATQKPRSIVMEYCHAGSLQEYLYTFRRGYPLPLQEVLDIGLQIADGLAYLHPHIVHLDLKPQNILFDANLTVKLADFGLSKWKDESVHHTRSITGTVNYMAPEQFSEFAGISERADVWSLAMVLWECIAGDKPYEKREFAQQYTAIVIKQQRPKIPENCPAPITKLLSACWQHEYQQRPSAVEIVHRIKQIKQNFTRKELDDFSTKIRDELMFGQDLNFATRPMTQPLHTMKSLSQQNQLEQISVQGTGDSNIGLLRGLSHKFSNQGKILQRSNK
eukprot:TRINITY_DN1752_c0_g1_i4.p1 TRINITY_DN1752_c0_g1~~TRINITY_DN1752_c0_g1_i4.p1  ORF type:complete len:1279 (-),score=157.50 TRINITY_DN1752_c0_g1_i4:253-4089(-)